MLLYYSVLQLNEGDLVHLWLFPQSSASLAHLFFPVPNIDLAFSWHAWLVFFFAVFLFCFGYFFGWLHLLVSWFPSTWLFQPRICSLNGLSKTNCPGTLRRITLFRITFICCCKLSLCSTEVPIKSTSAVCVLHLGPVLTFAFCDFGSSLWKNEKLQASVVKQGFGFRRSFSPVNCCCTFERWHTSCCAGALPDLAAVCPLSDNASYEPCHR